VSQTRQLQYQSTAVDWRLKHPVSFISVKVGSFTSIYGLKRSPNSNCYNARKSHTATDGGGGGKHECTIPPPQNLHFNHWWSVTLTFKP